MFETLPFSGLIPSIKKDTPAEVSGPVCVTATTTTYFLRDIDARVFCQLTATAMANPSICNKHFSKARNRLRNSVRLVIGKRSRVNKDFIL